MADAGAHATPSRTKRLPFKPTALRKASLPKSSPGEDADAEEDDLALFRRSKEMAPIVARDRERRLRRKQKRDAGPQRNSPVAEKRFPLRAEDDSHQGDAGRFGRPDAASDEPVVTDESVGVIEGSRELATPPPSKRSRLTSPPSQSTIGGTDCAEPATQESPSARRHAPAPRASRSPEALPKPGSEAPNANGVDVDANSAADHDDHDDANLAATPTEPRQDSVEIIEPPAAAGSPAPDDDDDDEFAKYVRQAEEQKRELAPQGSVPGTTPKETVSIYVTSPIPNSKKIFAKFTFEKPLRLLRDTWLASQLQNGVHIPPEDRDGVVLSWRRKKVYNASNLRNLGIRPLGNGMVAVDGGDREGLNGTSTCVHMEAWTLPLFADMERREERRRRTEAGELSDTEADREPEEPAPTEVKLRVTLRARDAKDLKLTVRPETLVETLVTGYKASRPEAADKEVSIWFDGERLAEDSTVADADIDDLDTIEVYLK